MSLPIAVLPHATLRFYFGGLASEFLFHAQAAPKRRAQKNTFRMRNQYGHHLKKRKKPYTARLGSDAKKWGRDGQARRRLFCGDEAVAHITI
jgi:hypothetical protein